MKRTMLLICTILVFCTFHLVSAQEPPEQPPSFEEAEQPAPPMPPDGPMEDGFRGEENGKGNRHFRGPGPGDREGAEGMGGGRPPQGPKGGGPKQGPPPPNHDIHQQFWQCLTELKRSNPEKFEELMKLRMENRQKFMEELGKLVRQRCEQNGPTIRQQMAELDKKCWKLAQALNKTDSEEEKAEIKRQLEETIRQSMDLFVENTNQRITQLQQQIQNIEENKEELVKKRMEFFTTKPQWRPGPQHGGPRTMPPDNGNNAPPPPPDDN